ncbi:SusD family protein [Salegentibacter agarivorans]|uniref:SusD family protein n=1 Tax=Salegentibacter agarivorans TaxID=345907 RepID=A0A1I2KNI0_9FLAO|nr:RagB/SusD family nutrient uptake outer membrane protein [Salegentibacter agarivorans]SFF67908.1 SusD family protein [Salegentibacter agarivorans]
MNYNKIRTGRIIFFVLAVLSLGSCSDYLEEEPYGEPTEENFYKTESDAQQALTAAYYPMREMFSTQNFGATTASDFIFGDIGTDDILKGGARSSDGPHLFEKQNYNLTTSNPAVANIWKVNYKGILYANLVLEKVQGIEFEDEGLKTRILAEANFLRAYYYFDLVNTFGGVPLIEMSLEAGEYNQPRASKEETYAFIENDLEKAIEDLPSRFEMGQEYLGHADKGAALGLMMRVSLYQNKMDQVRLYGEQILQLAYSLPNFDDIFEPAGEWNSGSVFEIDFSSNSDFLGGRIPHMLQPRNQGGIGFSQIKDGLRDEFDTNDPRFESSFYNVEGNYGTNWYNRKYSLAPHSNYQRPNVGGAGNNPHNIRFIRLADVYLMYAEAIYNEDPALAREYVNKVRTRARGENSNSIVPNLDSTLSGEDLLDAIYKERRLELAGEGLRYHDLVRTDRAETILAPLGFKEGINEIMPIPFEQVSLSDGVLEQNNGY